MWDIGIHIWDQPHASGMRSLCGCAALDFDFGIRLITRVPAAA